MKILKYILLIISVTLFSLSIQAQNETPDKKAPDLTFVVKKLADGSFELKSRLSLFENRIDFPVSGVIIDYTIGSDSLLLIDGNTTDKNGYAIAFLKPGVKIPRNNEGVITANAVFAGNELYESATTEVVFTETKIVVSCEMVDTVKMAKVEAYKLNSDGSQSPLSGEAVIVSLQRMFSRLPIGEVTLDEEGKGSLEFPTNLPGDSLGNLNVVAYIAEHEIYGNVEYATIAQWGIPKQQVLVTHRALWTQIAPMWMIVSLTILLVGVWAHYIYVVIQLIFIKKAKKATVI